MPLDWDQRDEFVGILRLYRDLIALRRNRDGVTRGLCGASTRVHHLDASTNVLAFHRWDAGGLGDFDDMACHGRLAIAPYSVLIFSQNPLAE